MNGMPLCSQQELTVAASTLLPPLQLGSQLCTMQRAPLCGGDGSEDMLVVCGWDGNTVMIDRRGNSVRFELGQYIRAFAIGASCVQVCVWLCVGERVCELTLDDGESRFPRYFTWQFIPVLSVCRSR